MPDPESVPRKRCSDCGESKPRAEFYRSKCNGDGLRGTCKTCWLVACEKWRGENRSELREGVPPSQVKLCSVCGKEKPLSEFHRHKETADGRRGSCKACWLAATKKWGSENKDKVCGYAAGQRARNPEATAARVAKWRSENRGYIASYNREKRIANPLEYAARDALGGAIRTGALVRGPCSICGMTPRVVNGRNRIEGHHWKGYDRENWLEIQWLCRLHHAQAERAMRLAQSNNGTEGHIPGVQKMGPPPPKDEALPPAADSPG